MRIVILIENEKIKIFAIYAQKLNDNHVVNVPAFFLCEHLTYKILGSLHA